MKSLIRSAGLITACGLILIGSNLSAGIFVASTTYNGHTYSLYEGVGAEKTDWATARAAADAVGGYLATLTTLAETKAVYGGLIGNGFFTVNSGQDYEAWLGARPADGSSTTKDSSNWAWITGEEWTDWAAGNFNTGEPNGDSKGLAINRYGTWTWNDEGGYVGGYIVEKNSIPDGGSTLLLLALGMIPMARFLRRR